MYVRKNLRVSGMEFGRERFGEYISFILEDMVRIVVIYRDSSLRSLADYDECIGYFMDTLNSTLPMCFIGDFNWSLASLPTRMVYPNNTASSPVKVQNLTATTGSTASRL